MSIEQAAAAFDADMGTVSSATAAKPSGRAPAEPIFSSLGDLEVDDDSPAFGGGDEELPEGVEAPKVKRPRKEDREEDDEDEEFDSEEQDEEADPDEEDDADEDEEKDPLLSRQFNVMVDGEETQVTVQEALQNFSHRKALDRRMNFVENARKAVITEGQNVITLRQKVDAQLAEAQAILEALIPAEPNWDELFAKDPAKARELQKQYEGFQGKVKEIKTKREENARKAQEDDQADVVRYRDTELRKFAGFAKWDSAKSRDKDLSSMRRTALSLGFSEQEVSQVMDSRMLAVLLKASKYDRMMANKPKPVNTRQQKSSTPGAGRIRTAPKGNDRAMKQLQRTGSVEAAASVFEGILKRS